MDAFGRNTSALEVRLDLRHEARGPAQEPVGVCGRGRSREQGAVDAAHAVVPRVAGEGRL
ncbi:MAG: hypothetical protein L0027_11535 [Candidatus Rokubacteria bacterium]|nr:hypothetical protein [Candidatus Rokubacteria bacterium]